MAIAIPASGLLRAASDSSGAQTLILSSAEWFNLQNAVQAVLALPSNITEFQTRYGDASSGLQMKECFDAMAQLRRVAQKYGNPRQLRSRLVQDPGLLAAPERPSGDAYAGIIWTLQRAHQDALRLTSTLSSIPVSARNQPAAEVVAGIKSLFLDSDQIVDRMSETALQLDQMLAELQGLQDELADGQAAMAKYTDQSSKTQKELNDQIGNLKSSITQLEKDRDAAYNKWLALTISAVAAEAVIAIVGVAISVILAAPTAGTSLAVGSAITAGALAVAGAALGTAAGVARTSYENLVTELQGKEDLLVQRVAYRHDLGALDGVMKFSLPSSTGFVRDLRAFRDGWKSTIQEVQYRVADLTTENLVTGPWLNQSEMADSSRNWGTVDSALRAFVQGSLVDSTLVAFGDAIPKDDPNWQKRLTTRAAAA